MNTNLIPNAFIRWHFATLSRSQVDIRALSLQHNIPDRVFHSDGRLLSANQYAAILLATFKYTDDESFGSLEQKIRQGSFQMMTHACITCRNLREVIERFLGFYRLLNDQLDWKFQQKGEQSCLYFNLNNSTSVDASYFISFISCVCWRWLSWMIDKPIELQLVQFNFPAPESSGEINHIFKRQVSYENDHNMLCFASDYLNLPVKQTADSLQTFLINVPQCLLSHYQENLSLSKKLREYLQEQPDLQGMSLAGAASHFHCSEQSLIRGLRAEGKRFKALREKILKQRVSFLLTKTDLSNQQIAAQLGFAEPSVFYRSVRKWFGMTPSQYRLIST